MTDYLSVEDLLHIAEGVLGAFTIRDAGLLSSAAARPAATVFGSDAYPTVEAKAAALLHSLARNHPLVDGNMRLAWAAARVLCLMNGHDLTYESVDDAEQLVLGIAEGTLDVPDIATWIRRHLVD